jgi:hypothetical protein
MLQPLPQGPPAGRAGAVPDSGEGIESDMFGAVRGAGLGPPKPGAPGNCTGSRKERSLWRRPVEHPDTSKTIVISAARRAVVFISLLLRECMVGQKPFSRIA